VNRPKINSVRMREERRKRETSIADHEFTSGIALTFFFRVSLKIQSFKQKMSKTRREQQSVVTKSGFSEMLLTQQK